MAVDASRGGLAPFVWDIDQNCCCKGLMQQDSPPSPPPSPPSTQEHLTLLTLHQDCLAQVLQLLHRENALLPLCCTSRIFNEARISLGLNLVSAGKLFVTRLRLLEWAAWRLPTEGNWLSFPLHRSQGCIWAAEVGCLPAILWLRGEGLWLCGEDCLAAAAGGGHHDIIIALWKLGCTADWRACAWAASEGHLFTLMVARRLGFVWDEMTCANAAGGGHMEILRWARSPDWSLLPSLPSLLASPANSRQATPEVSPSGSPTSRRRSPGLSTGLIQVQVASSSQGTAADMTTPPRPAQPLQAPYFASSLGHPPSSSPSLSPSSPVPSHRSDNRLLASPARHRDPPSPDQNPRRHNAAARRSLALGPGSRDGVTGSPQPLDNYASALAQLNTTGAEDTTPAPWDSWAIAAAAGGGHVDILEYIWSSGVGGEGTAAATDAHGERRKLVPDTQACAFAAACGQLAVIHWLRARGCPWDEQTCSEAAQGGHLETLRWCREHGCPWDRETAAAAAGAGRLEVLQWCVQEGCAWDTEVVERAREGNFDEIAEWALANGVASPPASPASPIS